jgi:hypothetical protein
MDISNLKIGSLTLEKGTIRKDVKMFAWDGIQECTGGAVDPTDMNAVVNQCPVTDMCTYIKRGKCAVQVKYLETLYSSILGTYTYLDEPMLFKIGMQIVPLYLQLVKLQIAELAVRHPTYLSDKGTVMVHPIFKEIRETMKTIHIMWKDLDLTFSFGQKPGLRSGEDPKAVEVATQNYEHGDPTFYKRLIENNDSQKGVIR